MTKAKGEKAEDNREDTVELGEATVTQTRKENSLTDHKKDTTRADRMGEGMNQRETGMLIEKMKQVELKLKTLIIHLVLLDQHLTREEVTIVGQGPGIHPEKRNRREKHHLLQQLLELPNKLRPSHNLPFIEHCTSQYRFDFKFWVTQRPPWLGLHIFCFVPLDFTKQIPSVDLSPLDSVSS